MNASEIETGSENPFGYAAPIWQHFRQPRRAGVFAPGTPGVRSGEAGTPAARSVLRFHLRFDTDGRRVADARFQAYGCPTSIAVGDWIAGWAVGREAADLAALDLPTLRAALEIPDDRAHCAVLGLDALSAALEAKPAGAPNPEPT